MISSACPCDSGEGVRFLDQAAQDAGAAFGGLGEQHPPTVHQVGQRLGCPARSPRAGTSASMRALEGCPQGDCDARRLTGSARRTTRTLRRSST